jgi:hypothetical protein
VTSAALHDDACRLSELAERYLHSDIRYNLGSAEYVVQGIVRIPEGITDGTPADQVRWRLLLLAEHFISALEPAGWQLADGIELQFRTEISNFTATIAGEVAIPSRQVATTLAVKVRVHRAEQVRPTTVIQVRRRAPEDVRARLLAGPLPPEIAVALAEEIAP